MKPWTFVVVLATVWSAVSALAPVVSRADVPISNAEAIFESDQPDARAVAERVTGLFAAVDRRDWYAVAEAFATRCNWTTAPWGPSPPV